MTKTVRIYGKTIQKWEHEVASPLGNKMVVYQVELAYKEYDIGGDLVGEGTEDFSIERYNREIGYKFLYIWDGKTLNRGGKRRFKWKGCVDFNLSQYNEVKEFLKNKYHDAEIIQLRGGSKVR